MSLEAFLSEFFSDPNRKPLQSGDPFDSEEYQKFVQSMAPLCRCKESNRPCDGVLAGGLCDDFQDEPEDYTEREDDDL